jgi:hypothetical protein
LRRLARGAKLSVASGAPRPSKYDARRCGATIEVERRHRWLTGTAAAGATGACGDSS